jgi:tRNA pseudouridine55 synthase
MARGKKALSINGVVVLDKPADMTSAQVVAAVKRALKAEKVGHTGTLDPFATGVLVCCLGSATKLARFFLHGDKGYEALLCLGLDTDTQDLTGQVVARGDWSGITQEQVEKALNKFTGHIMQEPPVYSALKHEGQALYKLARAGNPVQKPARPVHIKQLTLLEVNLPLVRFSCTCSGGTYIRSLCADIGRELGCGGHLQALRRTANSGFTLDDAVSLESFLKDAAEGRASEHFIGPADALKTMMEVTADFALTKKIRYGQALTRRDLALSNAPPEQGGAARQVKVVDTQRNLLAVLERNPDGVGVDYCCVFSPA